MKNNPLTTISLEEITDKYIGEIGTPKRDAFENELRLDLRWFPVCIFPFIPDVLGTDRKSPTISNFSNRQTLPSSLTDCTK